MFVIMKILVLTTQVDFDKVIERKRLALESMRVVVENNDHKNCGKNVSLSG